MFAYFAGFNPVWEDTISFILTFPELAIVRFVVWDEDPIGRDFIGQVSYPFSSLMPGKMCKLILIILSSSLTSDLFEH